MKIDTAARLLAIWAGSPQHTAVEAIADRLNEATRDAILADLAECVASPRWQETYQIAVSQEDLTTTLDSLIDRAITHKGKSMNTYRIINTTSGLDLGAFRASSEEWAILAMLADAGCDDEPSAALVAVLVTDDD
jgi:hypothetical protein